MQYYVVGLLVSLAACTFDSSAVGVGRDGGKIDAQNNDASAIDGGSEDAGAADATTWDAQPDAMVLLGANPITRHYIDEAATGEGTLLLDSVAPATNLVITADDRDATPPSYVELGAGMRGLVFNPVFVPEELRNPLNSLARASVATSTKIRDALHTKKQGTIELVVDVTAFGEMGRLSFLGHGTESDFSLHADEEEVAVLTFTMAHQRTMSWNINLAGEGRLVVHVVIDTTQELNVDRAKLFVDALLQVGTPGTGGERIRKNETIEFHSPGTHFYALGNRESGGRPVAGTFYYAALYASPLTLAEIQNNVELLTVNDDTP